MISLGPLLVFLLLVGPGIRLLSLASRTRERPEFWGGLYFVGAAIGLPMRVLGSSFFLDDPDLAGTLNTIGHVAFASGTIAMTVFTLHVFHPKSRAARILSGLTIAAILVTTAHTLLAGYASIENSYSMLATNAARLIPTSWAFYESLRYYRSMRRRQSLGLADPIVANRFLLWSIWTGALTFLPLITLTLRKLLIVAFGNNEFVSSANIALLPVLTQALRIIFAVIAPIAAIAPSLSFFPPASYLNRIRSRSPPFGETGTV
jgi:hypothetical protein